MECEQLITHQAYLPHTKEPVYYEVKAPANFELLLHRQDLTLRLLVHAVSLCCIALEPRRVANLVQPS